MTPQDWERTANRLRQVGYVSAHVKAHEETRLILDRIARRIEVADARFSMSSGVDIRDFLEPLKVAQESLNGLIEAYEEALRAG